MEEQKKPDEREADMMLAFRIFDADNKGYIESAELRYIILNMDNKIPRDELNELITIADLDRDRKINYQGKKNFQLIWRKESLFEVTLNVFIQFHCSCVENCEELYENC